MNGTITKHIFANGMNVATIEGSGATAKVYYATSDSLNSSSVITDSTGAIAETLDYLPFGGIRIDSKTGGFSEQRKYIGQEFDKSTGLNYLNARYYDSGIGKFISEDPVFLSIGDVNQIKQLTGKSQQEILSDPQNLNSYSYANNNPIVNSDPTGKNIFLLAAVMLFGDPMTETPNSMEFDPSGNHGQSGKNLQASLFAASFLVPGGAEEKGLAKGANFISKEGAQMVKNKIADIAEKIGSGHAYDKHLVNEGLFKGIANTKEELVNHVENVMSRPDRVENLGNGITAYGQEKTNTIVIHNPYGENLGTVYQNKNIQNKMNNLIKGSK